MGRNGGRQLRFKANAKCDPSVVLELAMAGQSDQAIAANVGVTPQRISQVLKPWRGLLKLHAQGGHKLADGGRREAEWLGAARSALLVNLVDPGRLAKAPVHALAFAFDKVNNASRLIEGKSTTNIGLRASIVLEAHAAMEASGTPPLTLPASLGSALALDDQVETVPSPIAADAVAAPSNGRGTV